MIEETAIVVECTGEFAWVEAQRKSSCSQCGVNKACGTGALAKVMGNKSARMKTLNKVNAQVGDTVLVGLEESAMLQGSLAVYMTPLISMLFFALLGKIIAGQMAIGHEEAVVIVFAISGFILAGAWLRRYFKRMQNDARFQPVILRRLSETSFSPGLIH